MLRFETTFPSPLVPSRARGALLAWLQAIGYRVVSPPFLTSVELQRGSWTGNFGSLNPRNWRSRVRLAARPRESGSEVTLEWLVTTAGQTCTCADIEFWRYEIGETQQVAAGKSGDPAGYANQTKKAQRGDTWRALVITVALLGPLAVVGISTDSVVYGLVACLVIGLACYAAFRAPRNLGEIPPPTPPPPAVPPLVPPPPNP